jgi:hypothetical protein
MIDDAVKLVSICKACQRFSCKMKVLAQPVQLNHLLTKVLTLNCLNLVTMFAILWTKNK